MADVKQFINNAQEKMQGSIDFLDETLSHIRAGKANIKLLDGIKVDYYGNLVPLANVSSINTPDAKSIVIQPWEKPMLKDIERAIINSNLGIMPENNGEIIRINIPPLTEERRKTLVKQSKQEAENAKIGVRNIRRDIIEALKKTVKEGVSEDMEKDAEGEVQKVHDKFIKKIDELLSAKEKEIMTV